MGANVSILGDVRIPKMKAWLAAPLGNRRVAMKAISEQPPPLEEPFTGSAAAALERFAREAYEDWKLTATANGLSARGQTSDDGYRAAGALLVQILASAAAAGGTGNIEMLAFGDEEFAVKMTLAEGRLQIAKLDFLEAMGRVVAENSVVAPKPTTTVASKSPARPKIVANDGARWTQFLEALEAFPGDVLPAAIAKLAVESGQIQEILRRMSVRGGLHQLGLTLFAEELRVQHFAILRLARAVVSVLPLHPDPERLAASALDLLVYAKSPEMRTAGAAVLGAVDSPAAVEALLDALSASPVREEAARSLGVHPRTDVGQRVHALLTAETLKVAKRVQLRAFDARDEANYLKEVFNVLGARRYEPAIPKLWKLAHARHDGVSTDAKRAVLLIIDDALVKRIFRITRDELLAKHTFLGSIMASPATVDELFEKARPTFKRMWG